MNDNSPVAAVQSAAVEARLLADAEEGAKMIGMIVFGYTLLTYLKWLIAPPPDTRNIR